MNQKLLFHGNSFQEQFKREVKKSKRYRKSLLKTSKMLDKDGYPTNECLEIIKKWHFSDAEGWFKFIKKYWRHSSFGWIEEDGLYGFDKKMFVHRYYISTGGWSGNESIIIAMEQNVCMWNVVWFQSQRGGHYIFEIYKVPDVDVG